MVGFLVAKLSSCSLSYFNQRPQKDVKLMVSNAVKYNKKTSPIVKGTSLSSPARMAITVASSLASWHPYQLPHMIFIESDTASTSSVVHVSSLPLNPPTDAHDIRKAVSDLLKENREKIDVCKPVGFGPVHSLYPGVIGTW
jgi:hypothetical protein